MKQEGKYYLLNRQSIHSVDRETGMKENSSWYGSLVFNWRASGTRIPFISDQYLRIKIIEEILGIHLIGWENEQGLMKKVTALIQKNRLFKGISLQLLVHSASDGSDKCLNQIRCATHPDEQFRLNEKGLILDIDPQSHPGRKELFLLQGSPFRKSIYHKHTVLHDTDEWVYENRFGQLLESCHSHIYLVKGDKVYTPKHQELTFWGIENQIKVILPELGKQLIESQSIQSAHLEQADEVFLADDFNGVRWAMGFRNKRYFRKLSKRIIDLINEQWQSVG